MKQIEQTNLRDVFKFRIDRVGELMDAVEKHVGEHYYEHYEHVMMPVPLTYPYMAYVTVEHHSERLQFSFVTLSEFVEDDPNVLHLYELSVERKYLVSPYSTRKNKYQVPGKDIFEALVAFGQTFHKCEEYDIKVLSWTQVK